MTIISAHLRSTLRSVLAYSITLVFFYAGNLFAAPPFSGTIFIDPDIITPSDPSSFAGEEYIGRGNRTVFDRRENRFLSINAYLFRMTFDDGLTSEAQVNPEFGSVAAAREQLLRHAHAIGQIPTRLRRDVDSVTIHDGLKPYGGGNRNILIHIGQTSDYETRGILAETLVHEAAHTSLDSDYKVAPGWVAAQNSDPDFISTYARDNPQREDVAESVLPYIAVRLRADRISEQLATTITSTIPNRLAFFDAQNFDLYPLAGNAPPSSAQISSPRPGSRLLADNVTFRWNRPTGATGFDLLIGTTEPGSSDIRASSVFNATSLNVTNLPTDGRKVYLRLWTYAGGWTYTDASYTSVDAVKLKADMQRPAPGSRLGASSVEFVWDKPENATRYDLIVGSNGPGSDNIRASAVTSSNSITVSGIPQNGSELNVRLWTYSNGWDFNDYRYDTTANNNAKASLQSPQAGSVLSGGNVRFVWDSPNGASDYDLIVGTNGVGSDNIRSSNVIRNNQLDVSGIPQDGKLLYVRLWTFKNGWKYTDYVFTTENKLTGTNVQTPRPGSKISSASTTFSWNNPSNERYFDIYVGTDGPGSSDIRAPQMITSTSVRVDNIPSDGRPIWVRFWTYKNGWKYSDYQF